MANVRNYEEYRAEVLDTLGATVEDLRNEPSFRAKVLETLGVEFTDEDTRNFERYRLKALEGLKNGGGGGGSSDISTAEVTIATTIRLGANYSLNCFPPTGNNFVSAIINDDGSLTTDGDDNTVSVNNPDIHNILFTKNGYIEVYTPTPDNIAVEGNGEVLTESIEGEEVTFVRAYGECTITINE